MVKKAPPAAAAGWRKSHDVGSHLKWMRGQSFAAKLRKVMQERGITQSQLARSIWGESPTSTGYMGATNRDRISKYLKAETLPDFETVKLLAGALNVDVDDLAPEVTGARLGDEHPEIRVTVLAEAQSMAHVTINTVMSVSLMLKILAMMEEDKRTSPTEQVRIDDPEIVTPPAHPETHDAASVKALREAVVGVKAK